MSFTEGPVGKFGPERVVDALREQLAERYDFIVSFLSLAQRDCLLSQHKMTAQNIVELPLLNGFAANLQVDEAFRLAEIKGVEWVWYLHPDEAELTRNALKSLNYVLNHGALVVNMSLGPPSRFYQKKPDFDAPVPRATLALARKGRLTVAAIGNTGANAPGYVNPWSMPPWVMSVGAWGQNANAVWWHSSTGDPAIQQTWPDVVAQGVDVIQPMTTAREKTKKERDRDAANARFRDTIPREKWPLYTVRSGSSMAAAQVTEAAGQVAYFLQNIIAKRSPKEGDRLFSIPVRAERVTPYDHSVARLTGQAKETADGGMEYTYHMDLPWKMMKQILIDTALPAPGADPWQAGAGIVDPDYIRAEFGTFGISKSRTMAVKVLE